MNDEHPGRPTAAPIVTVEKLTIAQPEGRVLLHEAGFSLAAGEVVILAGPSGSGKSTLVNLLSGAIDAADEGWRIAGHVRYAGARIDLARERITLGGVVFQNFALFDELTVGQNLEIAAAHNEGVGAPLTAAIEGLLQGIDRDVPVNACSGGQRQRVAIARTLLGNHPVLFLDEPNSGLDVSASKRLAALIKSLARDVGVPVVIIAHHYRHLIDIADRVLVLDPRRYALVELPADAKLVERELEAIGAAAGTVEVPAGTTVVPERATAIVSVSAGPMRASATWRASWALRFLAGYLWELCFAPSALLFVGLGSVIVGFVTTWFIFQYMPFRDLLMPIIHSDALAGLAFSELRVLAPLTTAVLISTRNAALIGADIGHKVYSDQIKSMRNLNVPHGIYLTGTILVASAVASVVLVIMSECLTAWVAMATWSYIFPDESTYMWRDQYFQRLWPPGRLLMDGTDWIAAKAIPSIVGAAGISLYFGYRAKSTVIDINQSIARALIWGLSFVLIWQSVLTLVEFKYVSANLESTF